MAARGQPSDRIRWESRSRRHRHRSGGWLRHMLGNPSPALLLPAVGDGARSGYWADNMGQVSHNRVGAGGVGQAGVVMENPVSRCATVGPSEVTWRLVDHWSRDHRPDSDRPADGALARKIIETIEPCLVAHGIGPANGRQRGSAVVWCSPVDQIQVVGQDATAVDCTDLWVEIDPDHSTISAHLEGEDLARHASGAGSMFEPAPPVSLGDHLDGALVQVARLLDELCSELVIIPRERDRSVD